MNEQYLKFKQLKDSDRLAKIKNKSVLTLEYYEKIGAMLDDPLYEDSYKFLLSISEWIETKEYITDKQVESIENLIRMYAEHGHYMSYERSDLPF